jgi:hypothetical protein
LLPKIYLTRLPSFGNFEKKINELRNALIEGESSPMVENFDAEKHLAELHQKHL